MAQPRFTAAAKHRRAASMFSRRRVLLGLAAGAGLGSPAPSQAALRRADAKPVRDILVIYLEEDSEQTATSGLLRALAPYAVSFTHAYEATASSATAAQVLRSGRHALEVAQLNVWGAQNSPRPARDLNDVFKSIGYRTQRVETGGSAPGAFALRPRWMNEAPLFIEVAMTASAGGRRPDTAARADAIVRTLLDNWQAQARRIPLILATARSRQSGRNASVESRFRLTLAIPGRTRQAGCPKLASSVDVVPTLLDWAGRADALSLPGQSLLPYAEGATPPSDEAVFASHDFTSVGRFAPTRSIRTHRFRLVHALPDGGGVGVANDGLALHDLQVDPHCLTNVAQEARYRETARQLDARLRAWRLSVNDPWRSPNLQF